MKRPPEYDAAGTGGPEAPVPISAKESIKNRDINEIFSGMQFAKFFSCPMGDKIETVIKQNQEGKMRNSKMLAAAVFIGILLTVWAGGVWAGKAATITGTVLDTYQIQGDDGSVYDVGDTEEGNKVLDSIGAKVKVTGDLEEDGEGKIIFVHSYEMLK